MPRRILRQPRRSRLTGSARGLVRVARSPCDIRSRYVFIENVGALAVQDLTESSPTLPKAGTMRSGTCFERSRSARRTAVSGSSYRERVSDAKRGADQSERGEGRAQAADSRLGPQDVERLADCRDALEGREPVCQTRRPHRTSDAVASWATPTAGDGSRAGRQATRPTARTRVRRSPTWFHRVAPYVRRRRPASLPRSRRSGACFLQTSWKH